MSTALCDGDRPRQREDGEQRRLMDGEREGGRETEEGSLSSVSRLKGRQCLSISPSVYPPLWAKLFPLIQWNIDIQQSDSQQTFTASSGWTLMTFMICSGATMRLTFVVWSEMSRQLLDGIAIKFDCQLRLNFNLFEYLLPRGPFQS